jgi:hypothetical protein
VHHLELVNLEQDSFCLGCKLLNGTISIQKVKPGILTGFSLGIFLANYWLAVTLTPSCLISARGEVVAVAANTANDKGVAGAALISMFLGLSR